MSGDNFVPFECPLCLTLMIDVRDAYTFFSHGCCLECREEYLIPNKIKNAKDAKISKDTKNMLRKKRKNVPSYILR